MEQLTPDAPQIKTRRAKWAIGCALIVAGIGGVAAWAVASPDAVSYYATPSEVRANGVLDGRTVRLGGVVAPGTLERDGAFVAFAVTDGASQVPVRYTGEVPDTLKEETDVVAEGTLSPDGTLVATRVMAKCSSKFEPADAENTHARAG